MAQHSESPYPHPYPSNALPGRRDVPTPYGQMRVYEWGPAQGRKVLFVHGDATPCPIFAKIAQGLVKKGCRVMLFDLWGRGYSDTPLDAPHDSRLFSMQMLLAVTSSPISWTGPNTFSIIAFSLGGPISLDFITTFPMLIEAVVFLGPAGLLRELPAGYHEIANASSLDKSHSHMRSLVEEVLGVDPTMPMRRSLNAKLNGSKSDAMTSQPDVSESTQLQEFDMTALVQWQYEFNEGHIYSFYHTVRHGPLMRQEHLWRKLSELLATESQAQSSQTRLASTKVLIVFGDDDDVIVGSETSADILKILPSDKVEFKYVPGDHGFVYPNSNTILEEIVSFWGLTDPKVIRT